MSIASLRRLQELRNSSDLQNSTLLSLLPFTNINNPWTTLQSRKTAITILERYNSYLQSYEFIVTYVLQSFVRPMFSRAPSLKSITASSRKAAPSSAPPSHFDIRESSPSRQPWRSNSPSIIPILQWVIESIPVDILRREAFQVLTPPVLTLLDSPSNSIRLRALKLLPALFTKMDCKLLIDTGLGSVFEDAIHPILLFLPSLTPITETLELLPAGYEALFALCDVQWPEKEDTEQNACGVAASIKNHSKPRLDFLDRIMRHAILPAHQHCQEIPSVVHILVLQIGTAIQKMKIWGVKHLKDILAIINNVLTNPFLPNASPTLIIDTLRTLRAIILELWPRISFERHRLLILQALAFLYGNMDMEDQKSKEKEKVHENIIKELRETVRVFAAAIQGAEDESVKQAFEGELNIIIEANGELASIFEVVREAKANS